METNSSQTRVFLLRHAETANPHVFHGAESDVGLSDKGRRQADAVAAYLAAKKPDVVVASAMQRAQDTARVIARACGLDAQTEPDLHERRVGSLSGMPTNQADGVWPQTARRWMAGETAYAPPGAESFDDIRARVLPVWERIARTHARQTVVVVAHGIVCKVLLLSILPGHSVADWSRLGPIPNVAITELVQRGGAWQMISPPKQPAALRERDLA